MLEDLSVDGLHGVDWIHEDQYGRSARVSMSVDERKFVAVIE
jgi:hypothetical protein